MLLKMQLRNQILNKREKLFEILGLEYKATRFYNHVMY